MVSAATAAKAALAASAAATPSDWPRRSDEEEVANEEADDRTDRPPLRFLLASLSPFPSLSPTAETSRTRIVSTVAVVAAVVVVVVVVGGRIDFDEVGIFGGFSKAEPRLGT